VLNADVVHTRTNGSRTASLRLLPSIDPKAYRELRRAIERAEKSTGPGV
jgi:hypothetical protein